MNWKSMSPERRKTVALAGIGAIGAIVLAVQFALAPALEAIRKAADEAAGLRDRMTREETILQAEPSARQAYAREAARWNAAEETVPPRDSPFLWATERAYRLARECGLVIDSLQETAVSVPEWVVRDRPRTAADGESATPEETRLYGPYGVQIAGQADFGQLTDFLGRLEREHPLLVLAALTITAGRTPERQGFRMVLEWPRFQAPETRRPNPDLSRGEGSP